MWIASGDIKWIIEVVNLKIWYQFYFGSWCSDSDSDLRTLCVPLDSAMFVVYAWVCASVWTHGARRIAYVPFLFISFFLKMKHNASPQQKTYSHSENLLNVRKIAKQHVSLVFCTFIKNASVDCALVSVLNHFRP